MAFVKTNKRNGKKFLYIVTNITELDGKRRQVVVQSLGEQGKDITKSQANAIRDKYNAKPNQFTHTKKTLKEAEEEFRSLYIEQVGNGVKQATFDLYVINVKRLSPLLDKKLKDIDFDAIEWMKIQLRKTGLSNRTINLIMMSLRKILKYSVRKKYLETLPEIQSLPEAKNEIEAHTEAEVSLMLEKSASTPALHRYIRLMLETGMRPEEVTRIKTGGLNTKESYLYLDENVVKKNTPPRNIPLRPEFCKELFLWTVETGRICPYLTTDGANTMLTRLGKKLGFGCYPKKLRATFASLMVQADANPFRLAEIMGNSVEVLQRFYVLHQNKKLREECEKNPFHQIFENVMNK